ncbi:hypothetical protein L1049_016187 [Liquidambar formosana]|uniref:FLZ-type domain-containing protein n=1 Tax=Liquidambar formosana TaxID=63359 RepID=A0AAP0S5U0_LIQFO
MVVLNTFMYGEGQKKKKKRKKVIIIKRGDKVINIINVCNPRTGGTGTWSLGQKRRLFTKKSLYGIVEREQQRRSEGSFRNCDTSAFTLSPKPPENKCDYSSLNPSFCTNSLVTPYLLVVRIEYLEWNTCPHEITLKRSRINQVGDAIVFFPFGLASFSSPRLNKFIDQSWQMTPPPPPPLPRRPAPPRIDRGKEEEDHERWGDRAFCSVDCRCKHIFMDEEENFKRENCSFAAMKPTSSSSTSSSSPSGSRHHRRGTRNRAGGFAY